MLDRESTFADKEIVAMLKKDFVPVALDQWYQRQQNDAEGRFYRKIAARAPRNDFNNTTQGFYLAASDGTFYFFNNNRGPTRIKALMKATLRQYKTTNAKPIEDDGPDQKLSRKPPQDGLVVRVNSKVLAGYPATNDRWKKIFHASISRDNLWIFQAEQKKLIVGEFADSLKRRIARFHLVDNTRGEPTMWKSEDVRKLDLVIDENGLISGAAHMETKDASRGYICSLAGKIKIDGGKVTKFDLVAKGEYWGEGRWTRGAPSGKFPFAVAFRLADGKDIADGVAPQGTKGWLQGYINP